MIDKNTFEGFFADYYFPLRNHAQKIVGRIETAENIVSGLFANIWENREATVFHDSPKGYLYTGVTNACLKHLEHEKVERNYHMYVQTMYEKSDRLWMNEDHNPENMMIAQEKMNEFTQAIDALQGQCKEVFVLRRSGLSYQEIAEKLHTTPSAVGVQLKRAIEKLRKSIGNNW